MLVALLYFMLVCINDIEKFRKCKIILCIWRNFKLSCDHFIHIHLNRPLYAYEHEK
jgi:hypothetical protein